MKKQFVWGLAIMALAVSFGPIASAQAAGEKIGFVDLARVFDEYNKTKEFDKQLEGKGAGKQGDRDKMVAKAKDDKQALIDDKIKALQDFDRTTRDGLRKERDGMVRDILKEIEVIIQDFGKSQGYSFIFNDRVLVYKSEGNDLTAQVIKVLNDNYTKKK
jgi:outer membrane protein